jgi:urease beta subunit
MPEKVREGLHLCKMRLNAHFAATFEDQKNSVDVIPVGGNRDVSGFAANVRIGFGIEQNRVRG